MDKKTGIILGIIGVIVVVLIAAVFIMDTNTVKLGKDTIIVVDGNEYTTQEFDMFAKIYNFEESGDIDYKMAEDETLSMLDNFLLQKIYFDAAVKHNVTLNSGDADNPETFGEDYSKDEETFKTANVSKDYYLQYREESALAEKLKMNLEDYYTLPDEIYEAVRDSFKDEDLYKTYSFRLMTIPYEVPESGDVSGDEHEGHDHEEESGDKEDLSREAQLAIAEDVLAKIKSGDNFEELAKEYGSTRLTFSGKEYKLINGELEYTTSPLLESKLNNEKLYDAILEMNSGDISEIIEDEEYTSFSILKLESVEEGFVGEGEKELKTILLNEYANDVVAGNVDYDMNEAGYLRSLYK